MTRRTFLAAAGSAFVAGPEVAVFLGGCNFSAEQFQPSGGRQSDQQKFKAAGVQTIVTAVGAGSYFAVGPNDYRLAGSDEWLFRKQIDNVEAALKVIRSARDTRLITDRTQLTGPGFGAILEISGNNHTRSLADVDAFARLGVRVWHPAMGYHNRWCSAKEGMPGPVLTDFGREAIARMNQLGIVVDTAHATDESALAFIGASNKPVIDTHTASSTRVPKCRGHSDPTLRAIADSGGVIGVHFAEQFLRNDVWSRKYPELRHPQRLWEYNKHLLATVTDPEERLRLRRDTVAQERFYRERNLLPEPPAPDTRTATVRDLADTIDYLVRLAGVDHVGLGGDVNGIEWYQWPQDMQHIGELPRLTAELLRRRYSERSLRKIYRDNWLRVYGDTLP